MNIQQMFYVPKSIDMPLKTTLIVAILNIGLGVKAQTVSDPSAVVTTGGDATAPDNSSTSYTVGQIDFLFFSDESSGSINQGVQQPFEAVIVSIDKGFDLSSVRIFPNPAKDVVHLHIKDEVFEPDQYQFRLHEITGKFSIEKLLADEHTKIPLEHLPTGTYFIEVINGRKQKAIFKIIKL